MTNLSHIAAAFARAGRQRGPERQLRQEPIIVLGMHRSGTTVLARILSALGIFMGHHLDPNHECRMFQGLNDWLLSLAHAAWDYPVPFRNLRDDDEIAGLTAARLQEEVTGQRFSQEFLGTMNRIVLGSSFPWGWKDPRNTVTFPIWHRVFGKAKYILITRHGIDVAQSIAAREQEKCFQPRMTLFSADLRRYTSLRCRNEHEALTLWEEYHTLYAENERCLDPHSLFCIRFEDLIDAPAKTIADIVRFTGVAASRRRVRRAQALVDHSRVAKYPTTPGLRAQWRHTTIGTRLGYQLEYEPGEEK